MADKKFIPGLSAKAPNDRAPEYVKAKLSIKRAELAAWLQQQDGEWINADVKVSTGGKWYVELDTWKPEKRDGHQPPAAPAPSFDDDEDLPF